MKLSESSISLARKTSLTDIRVFPYLALETLDKALILKSELSIGASLARDELHHSLSESSESVVLLLE